MSWQSRNDFNVSDKLHAQDLNNLSHDIRTWGGDVNGGGYTLSNVVLVGVTRTESGIVSSVFGRIGDVIADPLDYTPAFIGAVPTARKVIAGVGMDPLSGGPLTSDVTLNALVTSVFGRTGAVSLSAADITGATGVLNTRSVKTLSGSGLSGGGNLAGDLSLAVVPDTSNQQVQVMVGGVAPIYTRHAINFISGANVTVSVADDSANNRVNVQIASSGGGGGSSMTDPTTALGDLIVRGPSIPNRLAVGTTNGLVLTVDSASPLGMKWAAPAGTAPVTSVFGRTGAVVAVSGDYSASQITNAVDSTGSYASPTWITSFPWSKITGTPAFLVDPTTSLGDLIVHGGSGITRLPAGGNGAVLTADNTAGSGVRWAVPTTSAQSPWTTDIDGANKILKNVKSIGTGNIVPGTNNPLAVRTASADVSPSVSSALFGDGVSQLQIGFSTSYIPAGGSGGSAWIQAYLAAGTPCPIVLQPAGATVQPAGVGIGKTNPAYPLDVTGDINISGTYRVNGVALSTGGGGSQSPWTSDIDAASHNLNSAAGVGIGAAVGSTPMLRIQTPNPSIVMQGPTNSDIASIQMLTGTANKWEVGVGRPLAGQFYIRDITMSGIRVQIDSSGNVGIGHPAAYALDVAGDINCTGVMRINGIAIGGVSSIFGRTGAVTASSGDYNASQITNAVDVTQSYANPAWLTSLSWSKIIGAPPVGVSTVFGRSGAVVAATGDYTAAQVTGAVANTRLITAGTGLSGGGNLSADRTLAVIADSTVQKVQVYSSGALMATRRAINFVAGANVSIDIADDTGTNNWVTVSIASTGTGSGGMVDPTTTIGDLLVRGASAPQRLGLGTDGQVLTVDTAQTLGVKWATPTGGTGGGSQSPWTSNIDAAGFKLNNVKCIGANTSASNFVRFLAYCTGTEEGLQVVNDLATGYASASLRNDIGEGIYLRSYGSSYVTDPGMGSIEATNVLRFSANGTEVMRATSGHVLIGTTTDDATHMLQVAGTVKSTSGGFVFPDGTTQSTAATGSGSSAVSSVFSRTGAITAQGGDYNASQITNAVDTTASYSNPSWLTTLAWSKITGAPTIASSVFGRSGDVVATTGDYTAAQVTGAVSTASTYADPAWITALAWSKITSAPAFLVDPTTAKGDLLTRSAASPAAPTRLPVGSNNQVLMADSAQTMGIKWGSVPLTPWTANIDGGGFSLTNVGRIASGTEGAIVTIPLDIQGSGGPPATTGTSSTANARIGCYRGGPGVGTGNSLDIGGYKTSPYAIWMQVTDLFGLNNIYPLAIQPNGGNTGFGGTTNPGYTIDATGDVNCSGVYRIGGTQLAAANVTNAVSTASTYSDPAWITGLAWSKITSAPAFMVSPLTTKGDIHVYGPADARLPVGSNNQILTADSTQTTGVKWAPAPVTTVFTRSGAVVATAGDYTASQVTNAVDTTQSYNNPAWITGLAWSKISSAPAFLVSPLTTKGDIHVYGPSDARLGVGANNSVLTADSAQTTGVKWATVVNSFNTRTGAVTSVLRIGHTFAVMGDLSGVTTLPSMFLPVAATQAANLVGIRAKLTSGTSVGMQVRRNGANVGSVITVTATAATTALSQALTDGDEMTLVLSSPVGTPTNLSASLIVEHTP